MARAVGWLAGLLVLLAVVPGCTSHAPGGQAPSARPSASTAVDGGDLHLVESGFQVEPAPPGSAGTQRALIGVVVENTSRKQEAKATRVTVQLFDAAGDLVFIIGGSHADSGTLGLPWVLPGGRVGMGLVASNHYDADQNRTPVRMVVTIGASDWVTPESQQAIEISGVRVDQHADGSADLNYTSKVADLGDFTDSQAPRVGVLFRDSAGKLLGGADLAGSQIDNWVAGTLAHRIAFTAAQWKALVPAGADLSRTEVYGAVDSS